MDIRQSTQQDVEKIFELLICTANWLKDICPQQWPMDWLLSKRQELKQSIEDGQFYIVEIEDKMAAIFEIKTQSEPVWNHNKRNAYYVHKLAVDQKYKKMNLGPKIIRTIFDMAKQNKIPVVRLDCVSANSFLKQFYLDQGFSLMGSADDEGEEVLLFEYVI
ncbi:GNAT family N-acetyltransferase [Marinicellulosiphila megalodicopiae]|uniref:GNAT family N-acetyltransferase n=1 Tax=Marinicellulosiphila megalodicopiae TaxID=2724896 RepID=UPI003BB1576B